MGYTALAAGPREPIALTVTRAQIHADERSVVEAMIPRSVWFRSTSGGGLMQAIAEYKE